MSAVGRFGTALPEAAAAKKKPQHSLQFRKATRAPVQANTLVKKPDPKPVDKVAWNIFYSAAKQLASMDDVFLDDALQGYADTFRDQVSQVKPIKTKEGEVHYTGVPIKVSKQVTKLLGLVKKQKIPVTDQNRSAYPHHELWKKEAETLKTLLEAVQPPTSCGESCVMM